MFVPTGSTISVVRTCILYESIPLHIITSYATLQYTSEHCFSSFTYSDIIWLTYHCSVNKNSYKVFNYSYAYNI